MSNKATVDYLRRHFKEDVSLQKIYRYLDKLYNTQQELVQAISVEHTRELFGGNKQYFSAVKELENLIYNNSIA